MPTSRRHAAEDHALFLQELTGGAFLLVEQGAHFDGGFVPGLDDGLLHVGGQGTQPVHVHDHGAGPQLVVGFGDVLLHFIEAVGGDGDQRVVLTVHDLLLEGVEGFVHGHGNRVRAPGAVHADHDRVVGGTDLDRSEVGQLGNGLLAVGDEAEALRMPRDGDGAAFGFMRLLMIRQF